MELYNSFSLSGIYHFFGACDLTTLRIGDESLGFCSRSGFDEICFALRSRRLVGSQPANSAHGFQRHGFL